MNIIGFNFNKISIERKDAAKGELKVSNKLEISNITKEEISISKDGALKVDFEYIIEYEPKVAVIELKGHLLVLAEEKDSKEILKEWKEKKKFTHVSKIALLNFILDKCLLKALVLEEELGLPKHMPFPKLTTENPKPVTENKAKYMG
jgi:hypothetical protein